MKIIQFLPWKAKSDQIIIGALTSYFQGLGTRVKSGAIIDLNIQAKSHKRKSTEAEMECFLLEQVLGFGHRGFIRVIMT